MSHLKAAVQQPGSAVWVIKSMLQTTVHTGSVKMSQTERKSDISRRLDTLIHSADGLGRPGDAVIVTAAGHASI